MSRPRGSQAEFLLYACIVGPVIGVLCGVALLVAGVESDRLWWLVLFGMPIVLTIGCGVALRRPGLEIGTMVLVSPLLTFIAGLVAFAVVYDAGTFQ
jgi:hypothetical protein